MYRDGKDVEHIGIYWNLGREIREMYLEALRLGERAGLSEEELSRAREVLKVGPLSDIFYTCSILSMILYRQSKAVYLGFLTFSQAGRFLSAFLIPKDLDGRDQAEYQLREAIKRRPAAQRWEVLTLGIFGIPCSIHGATGQRFRILEEFLWGCTAIII